MQTDELGTTVRIAIDFRPEFRLVSTTREYLDQLCGRMLDPDVTFRLTMAAHELLENIVKYSSDGRGVVEVRLEMRNAVRYLVVSTKNRASAENVAKLSALVRELVAAPDPEAVYDDMIRFSASREGSGLGLARIRAEGHMQLTCCVDGNEVTLVAETRTDDREYGSKAG